MELELVVALELLAEAGLEGGLAVEASDLVFVLVRQQLGVIERDGFREAGLADLLLGGAHFVDQRLVALGQCRVLVAGQVLRARGHDLVERLGLAAREGDDVVFRRLGCDQLLDGGAVGGGAAAPAEGGEVHRHSGAVQLDGALDRLMGEGDQALLIGVAQDEHVGGDRIAHQRRGDAGRVEELDRIGAGRGFDRELQGVGREGEVGMAGELAGDGLVRVDDGARDAGLEARQRVGAGADDQVAA